MCSRLERGFRRVSLSESLPAVAPANSVRYERTAQRTAAPASQTEPILIEVVFASFDGMTRPALRYLVAHVAVRDHCDMWRRGLTAVIGCFTSHPSTLYIK